eukprot:5076462-Amphidinium_carterae.1
MLKILPPASRCLQQPRGIVLPLSLLLAELGTIAASTTLARVAIIAHERIAGVRSKSEHLPEFGREDEHAADTSTTSVTMQLQFVIRSSM